MGQAIPFVKKRTVDINIGCELSGRFRAVVSRDAEAKDVKEDTGWFCNTITNNGLNLMATGLISASEYGFLRRFCVGTGTALPDVTQTQLDQFLAEIAGPAPGNLTNTVNQSERYASFIRSAQFGEGAAAGNVSEIGIGWESNHLFARQLIRDEQGDPTTITVLSNEFLTVYYELRINQPIVDSVFTVSGIECTLRASLVNSTTNIGNGPSWNIRGMVGTYSGTSLRHHLSRQEIQPIDSSPSSLGVDNATASSVSNSTYATGSYSRSATVFWDINRGNPSDVIRSYWFMFCCGAWQVGFNPPIEKDNTKELTIVISAVWAREGELPV